MSKQNWLLLSLGVVIVALIGGYAWQARDTAVRAAEAEQSASQAAEAADQRVNEVERVAEEALALAQASAEEYFDGTAHDGTLWRITKRPSETAEEFVARVDRILAGVEKLESFCWESDCPGDPYVQHAKLCSTTQSGLTSLVSAWCQAHPTCTECP